MSLRKLWLLTIVAIVGCRSYPKVVNQAPEPLLVPMQPPQVLQGPGGPEQGSPLMIALSGAVVVTDETLPRPASRTTLQLIFLGDPEKPVNVAQITTGPEGTFEFSRKLAKGKYLLKVDDRKWFGEKILPDVARPIHDIIVEVKEKNKK